MLVHLMELQDNLELELLGKPRKAYKKGAQVIVHSSEYIRYLKMGLTEVESKELTPEEIFPKKK